MSSAQDGRGPVNRAATARSAKWSMLENGGLAVISFSSLVIYARFLSVSDFGVFSVVLALTELLTAFVSMLFHDALVQQPNVRELHYDSAFTATLALSVLLAALCWLFGPLLVSEAISPVAGPALAWLALSMPFAALGATLVARRRRELDFRLLALRHLFARSGAALAGITLVLLGFGVWGLVTQHLLLLLLSSLALWLYCRDRPRLRFARAEFRDLIGFGLASVSALIGHFSVKRAFILVTGISLGAHGAGLLNMSFRAVDGLWALGSTTVSQIALPVLSSLRGDGTRFRRAFERASAFICATMYFGFVLVAATSPEVVRLLLGAQWDAVAPYVALLALQVLVQARRLLFGATLTALGHPGRLLWSPAAELAFLAAAIALFGVPSVAWAVGLWLARDVLGGVLEAWLVGRAAHLRPRELLGGSAVPLAAALAMYGVVWMVRQVLGEGLGTATQLAVLAYAGASAYFACIALLDRALLVEIIEFVRSAVRPDEARVHTGSL